MWHCTFFELEKAMLDGRDDDTRVGLWVTLGLVTLVVVALVGSVVVRHLKGSKTPAPAVVTAPAEVLLEGPLTGELTGTLYFASGGADLPAEAQAELASVKAAVEATPTRKLVLSGFHDTTGDPAMNAELAKKRAIAVREALKAAGVDGARIQLRKPESTAGDGRPEHARRVEIRLVD
jgi:outer membrane protein OmpA-like peptidoglycan-associated protein